MCNVASDSPPSCNPLGSSLARMNDEYTSFLRPPQINSNILVVDHILFLKVGGAFLSKNAINFDQFVTNSMASACHYEACFQSTVTKGADPQRRSI